MRPRSGFTFEHLQERRAERARLRAAATQTGEHVDFDRVVNLTQGIESVRRRPQHENPRADSDKKDRLARIDEAPAEDLQSLLRKRLLKQGGVPTEKSGQQKN